jgi:NitT/TauT family transport system substrate-binding protein
MLTRALDTAGLSLSEVNVVPLGIDEHFAAFHDGRVDALVTFDPVRSRLLKEGASQLFSSADIPGEITDVLVVSRNYLSAHPEVVSTLIDGWNRVIDSLHKSDNPDVVQAIAKYSGLNPETVSTTLQQIIFPDRERNRATLYNTTDAFREMARKMNETMLQGKVIGSRVDVDRLLCPPEDLTVYR